MNLNRYVVALFFVLSAPFLVHAAPNLEGLWFETENYPASSVMRFERYGTGWAGRYVKVSPDQRAFGFSVGELVIRGAMQGDRFKGEVLLKIRRGVLPCPGRNVGWVPIQMKFSGNKLEGAWLQTFLDLEEPCKEVGHHWQAYDLERFQ